MNQYNLRNPAVKRLMKEAEELRFSTKEYHAQPLEDNLFEWHFTLGGPSNTEFEGGVYHGRITLPPDYPMKPPSIILLTPNGRFETNKKICLSISGYHPESWQPSWSIRTALVAIIGFLPTHGNGAIGSLDYTPEERKKLAIESRDWKCSQCGDIKQYLKEIKSVPDTLPKIHPQKEVLHEEKSNPSNLVEETSNGTNNCDDDKSRICLEVPESAGQNCISSSSSIQKEINNLRCRHQPVGKIENLNSDESVSTRSGVSLVVIWVIVILLAILLCRRIIYQC